MIISDDCVFPCRCFVLGELANDEEPRLKQLAESLYDTVLQGKAPSTTKKYLGGFRRWKLWATDHKVPVFPAKEYLCLEEHLGETKLL